MVCIHGILPPSQIVTIPLRNPEVKANEKHLNPLPYEALFIRTQQGQAQSITIFSQLGL